MFKKTILLSAGIAATLMGGTAMANTGYIGAAIGTSQQDDSGTDDSLNGWNIEGAVATGGFLGTQWQLDGFYGDGEGDNATFGGGTAHLNFRNSNFLVGGFAGIQTTGDYDYFDVGVEGQIYLSPVTISGALTYLNNEDDVDGFTAAAANVGAKFFITDNVSIGGHVADFEISPSAGAEYSIINGGINGEFKLSGPISFFAQYEHVEIEDADYSSENLGVGIRYNFGTTLKDRDRTGASLADVSGIRNLRF